MERYKNLALTGARQAGKSTLAEHLLTCLDLPYGGFRTTVYARTAAGPLYQLTDVITGETEPISHLTEEGIRGISAAFDGLGVRCLEGALRSDAPLLLLDEVGRFERNSPLFLQAVTRALDSPKRVILVLKKEELPYIADIRAREDTLVIDLDTAGRKRSCETVDKWRLTVQK